MSRVLVDTHAVLWWLADDSRLPDRARATLADSAVEALVSIGSLWEIAIKRGIGKLKAPDTLPEAITAAGFRWLAIDPAHAWSVSTLPEHHRDPFDRLLIAQALEEDLAVVTADERFGLYGVEVRW